MLKQGVDVLAPVWFWCSEVTSVFNFFSGLHSLLDFWKLLVNLLTNGSEAVIIQWDRSVSFVHLLCLVCLRFPDSLHGVYSFVTGWCSGFSCRS
jgi:hypothetical protein